MNLSHGSIIWHWLEIDATCTCQIKAPCEMCNCLFFPTGRCGERPGDEETGAVRLLGQ